MTQTRLGPHMWAEAESLSLPKLLSLVELHARYDARFSATVLTAYSTEPDILSVLLRAADRYCAVHAAARQSSEAKAAVIEFTEADHSKAHLAVVAGHLPRVWLLVTDATRSSREFRKLLEPALRVSSRRMPNAWLSTRQIQAIVLGCADKAKLAVTPTRVSSVQRDGSTIRFPRETTGRELFARLEGDEAVLRSLDFLVGPASRPALKASLDRSCRASFRGGLVRVFEQSVLLPLEDHTQKHFRRLGVSRQDALQGKEIRFKFRHGVMADTSANRRLIDTLGRISRASVNAYHSNPYLHVAVTDLWDGSTMDLFAHTPDELLIIPGDTCSERSISRVFDRIYDCFAAGEIEDVRGRATADACGDDRPINF